MNQRRQILKLLAATSLSGLIHDTLAKGDNPLPPGLHKTTGEVKLNGKTVKPGTLILPGDTVSTGPGAQAIYVIGQDAYLQRDNSVIQFGAEAAKDFLRVVNGKLLAVFGKREGTRNIRVSTATIGIRGTGCYIEDTPAKVGAGDTAETYFCLCYGSAELIPDAHPAQREGYITRHHDRPLRISNNRAASALISPAPMINHSDAELAMLETLVGRQVPFYGKPY